MCAHMGEHINPEQAEAERHNTERWRTALLNKKDRKMEEKQDIKGYLKWLEWSYYCTADLH